MYMFLLFIPNFRINFWSCKSIQNKRATHNTTFITSKCYVSQITQLTCIQTGHWNMTQTSTGTRMLKDLEQLTLKRSMQCS